jgi:hypothetical protein
MCHRMSRDWVSAVVVMCALAALPALAQETRGTISGTVNDSTGVIPGANVQIKSVDTGATYDLVTNGSGYFEAPLLQPGKYDVTVEMPGFKRVSQSNLTLSVGQSLTLRYTLEIGEITESITVTGEAPMINVATVASGQNFDNRMIDNLPMASDQPMLLVKFSQGVISPTNQQQVVQGQIDGPNSGAGTPVGGVGSFNFTLDGVTNAGNNRRMANSPNADIIQEMRVETSNFDASLGHGTGATVAMMTKAGTSQLRGTFNFQYYNQGINSVNPQQKLLFAQRPATEKAYKSGHAYNGAGTLGGPVTIPGLIRSNKLFFFANYQANKDNTAARSTPTSTVPASAKWYEGDFSNLLSLPNPSQYQIYDPLTVRPDPLRPGSFIRDPFPGNIIPRDRFMNPDGTYKNPLFAFFKKAMPPPNQNFVEQGSVPTNNYYAGAIPAVTDAANFGGRLDYNLSANNRFFFRYAGTKFHERISDWTYETELKGLHTNDKTRHSWAYTGTWTRVKGMTVLDASLSANRFYEDVQRLQAHTWKPSDVGLPTYLDDYCKAASNCMEPIIQTTGYQTIGNAADGRLQSTNVQGQGSLTTVKGNHSVKVGVDIRRVKFEAGMLTGGNVNTTWVFDNTFTRAADTTAVFPSSSLGTGVAAMLLGIPTQVSIGQLAPIAMTNPWYGVFFQDNWRVNQNLTISPGFRYEYEDGLKEAKNRWITRFDPQATLAITQLAQQAYAANPIPQVPVNQFQVLGGAVYGSTPGAEKSWKGESMFMPRIAATYMLNEKTAIKTGYGLFYDVLTAADYALYNQLGYSTNTTNVSSNDFGQTWLLGNPKNGVLATTDPFPVRTDGTRFDSPLADSLGANVLLGSNFTAENPDRKHARVQRWRAAVQRELFGTMSVEVAYTGSYADRVARSVMASYVPEQYYSNVTDVRDASAQSLLQQQVPNPFYIGNFASLQTSNPALYARMASNSLFTARTTQRQNLIRAFPQLAASSSTCLVNMTVTATPACTLLMNDLPLGVVKSHSLEISVARRYSRGLSANLAFAANHVVENAMAELFNQKPNIWMASQNGRPWSLRGGVVYELPLGSGKPFLAGGGVASKALGGWQVAGTFEAQPGALLDWTTPTNLFYTGDLKNIVKSKPEIALQKDGTVDPTKYWFNVDGFVRATTQQPAAYQKRTFPFRVDGLRGTGLFLVNMNVMRSFPLGGGRSLQFRVDVQNLFNAVLWGTPTLDPTDTNFGKITSATNSLMRFFTFFAKVSF